MQAYTGDVEARYQVEILGALVCPEPAKMSRHVSMTLCQLAKSLEIGQH